MLTPLRRQRDPGSTDREPATSGRLNPSGFRAWDSRRILGRQIAQDARKLFA